MNKRFQPLTLWVLVALSLFVTACGAQIVRAEPAEVQQAAPKAASYQDLLGESVKDKSVADFIASNCSQSGSLRLCPSAGLALWTDKDQVVRQAYLYISKDGFATYKAELPFGLKATDTMADVEQKLGHLKEVHAPQAGWVPGLPDESFSRDLTYYWAVYNRFGLTVIYNTPAATDKDATIYEVIVSE